MFNYFRFSNSCIFRGARPWSLKEVRECLLCSESASAPSWLAWVEDSYIQTDFHDLRWLVKSCMYGCCLGVLQCSAQDNLVSCDDTLASQTRPTCIVPIVFSRLLFKSPPDLQCVNIFQYVMIDLTLFWITWPTRLCSRRWTSLLCQQRRQGTWGSAPRDKQVIS